MVISNESVPYEIEVKGVYNSKGNTLTSSSTVAEGTYYFLFRVKDQYQNYLKVADLSDTTLISTFSPGITGLTSATTTSDITTVTVDDVDYLAYTFTLGTLAAGTATLVMIPTGSGKGITETVEVAKGGEVDTITVTATSVPEGDTTYLDYVAYDANGNEVTSYAELKKLNGKMGDRATFVKKKGKVLLRYTTGVLTAGSVDALTITTASYKTSVTQIKITEAHYPVQIVGLVDYYGYDYASAQISERELEDIYNYNFVVVDQYGDYFDLDDDHGVKVIGADELKHFTASSTITITDAQKLTLTAMDAAKKGTDTLTFAIVNTDGTDFKHTSTTTGIITNVTTTSQYTRDSTM